MKMNSSKLDLTAQHMDNLMRNLSGFNLEVDKIAKNGNFFSEQLPRGSVNT